MDAAAQSRVWAEGLWRCGYLTVVMAHVDVSICIVMFVISTFCTHSRSKVTKDVQHALCQLIAVRGLLTDTLVAGVERMVVTEIQNNWLQKPRQVITSADIDAPGLLDPQTVFTVKGWNRSSCALLVLLAAYEMPEFLQAGVIC